MTGTGGRAEWMRASLAVASRDLLEFIRDRRTLFITLLMPMAMYPVLALSSMLGVRTAVSDIEMRQAARKLSLALSGADAEAFADRLRGIAAAGATPSRPDWPAELSIDVIPADAVTSWLDDGKADVWLFIPPGTLRALDGQGTVNLDARQSASRPVERRIRDHFTAVMRGMADDARMRRVTQSGLAATTLTPLAVEFPDEGEGAAAAAARGVVPMVAGGVLMLLALLTATGAFYPAIDAIAGEKERGTVETLLIAPCRPGDIVFGKFLAVFAVTLATLAMNAVSIGLTATVLLRFLPAGTVLGLGPGRIAACAAVAVVAYVGLAALAAALCLAVTSASKSVKEAQNTLTPVILLVSGLAGAALAPGLGDTRWLAAVPFAGQVSVAKSMLEEPATPEDSGGRAAAVAVPIAISLASSIGLTWLLLRAATASITDEELLFRGPDAAGAGLRRPGRRSLPTVAQGFAAAFLGLAALWYAQGIAPVALQWALPFQQTVAVLLPLAMLAWWQRVDAARTFRLRWPGGSPARGTACVVAAAVCGAALFLAGAALLLAVRGTHLSAEARLLAERIVGLLRERPWWLSWTLIAVVPAVCEEAFFRGWMLSAFAGSKPSRGRAAAAIATQAACFAAFHLLPERMPQTFALGVLLGWMTLRSGSLLPAVVAHMAHNSVPLVLFLRAADDDAALATMASGLPGGSIALAIGCLAAGAAAVHALTSGPDAGSDRATAE
jgi:sodium transport system permease protein